MGKVTYETLEHICTIAGSEGGLKWNTAYTGRHIVTPGDKFWHGLVEEGRKISKKYGGNRFVANLIANEIREFEEVYKQNKKKE